MHNQDDCEFVEKKFMVSPGNDAVVEKSDNMKYLKRKLDKEVYIFNTSCRIFSLMVWEINVA